MTVDYAHTRRATANRETKAHALAAAARRLGVPAAGLGLGLAVDHRREVRTLAQVKTASEETWHEVVQILATDPPPAGPRPRGCDALGCTCATARLYLCGWRCDEHSPAALAGRAVPVPPAGTTAADLRAARPPVIAELDARIEAAKKPRESAAKRAKLASYAHRLHRDAERARGP